jgi:hypothetical protein
MVLSVLERREGRIEGEVSVENEDTDMRSEDVGEQANRERRRSDRPARYLS